MKDSRLVQTILLDFYGELLTEKQRECCDLHYNEDLSLSEIAEQCGISRQGVWDNIRRAEATLSEIEEKTGLVRRFAELRKAVAELSEGLEALTERTEGETKQQLEKLLDKLAALDMKG